MRKIFVFITIGFACLFAACSSEKDPGEIAANTAKIYYDYLLEGKYEQYVDGLNQPDSIPQSYREQLITNAKMFIEQQTKERRGIREIRIASAKADTANHSADVFLIFCYGDSTNEEVVVPMVERKGVWFMR